MSLFDDLVGRWFAALERTAWAPRRFSRSVPMRRRRTPPDCWRDGRGQLWRWTRKGWRRRKH